MDQDLESQQDELLALQSIFDTKVFNVIEDVEGYKGNFIVSPHVPEGFKIVYRPEKAYYGNGGDKSYSEHSVQFLPNIILTFVFPMDYPSKSSPSFTLSCQWLTRKQLSTVCSELNRLWNENCGSVILYLWYEFLTESTLDCLNLQKLDITWFMHQHHVFLRKKDRDMQRLIDEENNLFGISKRDEPVPKLINIENDPMQEILYAPEVNEMAGSTAETENGAIAETQCNRALSIIDINRNGSQKMSKSPRNKYITSQNKTVPNSPTKDNDYFNDIDSKCNNANSGCKNSTVKANDISSKKQAFRSQSSDASSSEVQVCPASKTQYQSSYNHHRRPEFNSNNSETKNTFYAYNNAKAPGGSNKKQNPSLPRREYYDSYESDSGYTSKKKISNSSRHSNNSDLSATSRPTSYKKQERISSNSYVNAHNSTSELRTTKTTVSPKVKDQSVNSTSEAAVFANNISPKRVNKNSNYTSPNTNKKNKLLVKSRKPTNSDYFKENCPSLNTRETVPLTFSYIGLTVPPSELSHCDKNETVETEHEDEIFHITTAQNFNCDYSKPYVKYLDDRAVSDYSPQSTLLEIILDINSLERKKIFNTQYFDCGVCFAEKIGAECFSYVGCNHVFCTECVKMFFEIQITNGNERNLTCMYDKCKSEALPLQIKELVSADLYTKYESRLLASTLATMAEVTWCPRRTCQCECLIEPLENMVTCPRCNYAFCCMCKMVYHGIEPCKFKFEERKKLYEEYNNGDANHKSFMEKKYGKKLHSLFNIMMSENWLIEKSKNCPACKAPIEKQDGCNKMTCFRCGAYFCWLCKSKLDPALPYLHYQVKSSRCFNQLFLGVEDEMFDEQDWLEVDEEDVGAFL